MASRGVTGARPTPGGWRHSVGLAASGVPRTSGTVGSRAPRASWLPGLSSGGPEGPASKGAQTHGPLPGFRAYRIRPGGFESCRPTPRGRRRPYSRTTAAGGPLNANRSRLPYPTLGPQGGRGPFPRGWVLRSTGGPNVKTWRPRPRGDPELRSPGGQAEDVSQANPPKFRGAGTHGHRAPRADLSLTPGVPVPRRTGAVPDLRRAQGRYAHGLTGRSSGTPGYATAREAVSPGPPDLRGTRALFRVTRGWCAARCYKRTHSPPQAWKHFVRTSLPAANPDRRGSLASPYRDLRHTGHRLTG